MRSLPPGAAGFPVRRKEALPSLGSASSSFGKRTIRFSLPARRVRSEQARQTDLPSPGFRPPENTPRRPAGSKRTGRFRKSSQNTEKICVTDSARQRSALDFRTGRIVARFLLRKEKQAVICSGKGAPLFFRN
jgi:hypothetical protein